MQALARLSVNRPVVAAVLILVLVVVGGFSIGKLGVDRFPNIDVPMVTVTTTLPGATPEDMETQVTEQIEKQVNTVSGIDYLRSTSAEGVSVVMVMFKLEKDGNVAADEVRAKVDLALPNLPDEANKPVVQKMDTSGAAIIGFTLTAPSASVRTLTEYADKKLRPQVENINGVGAVEIVGGQARQVNVMLDPYALRAFNLTALQVRGALAAQNLQVPGGSMDNGDRRVSIRTQGRVQSVAALADVVVATQQGRQIRVRDVATVEDGAEEQETVANVDGRRAILLNVRKQSGANTVAVIQAVKERLNEISGALPPGYKTRIVADQSTFIVAALNAVEEHLVLGAILASIIVLLFLWNWRSAIIAAIAIPASLISAFTLMSTMGFTLNVITLLALTLAVGIVIDDAVIVLENIHRFLEEKSITPRQAVIEATQEIGLAVLATTFSLIAVFVPVAFMTGIVGRFLNSFGLTMAFAILVSLLVAFSLTPMLSARWLRSPRANARLRGTGSHEAGGAFVRFERGYAGMLRWSLHRRWLVVVVSAVVFLSMVPLSGMVGKNFLPDDDESQFNISVRAPEGTTLAATERLANRIAADVRRLPEVDYTVVTVAADSQKTRNLAGIAVHMKAVEDRKSATTETDLIDRTRHEVLPRYPRDLRTIVSPPDAIQGSGASAAITYVITGPDLKALTSAANRVAAELRKVPEAVDVDTSSVVGKPEVGVRVDRKAAADLGVSVADVGSTLRILVAGMKVSDFAEGGYQYDVNLRAMPEYRTRRESLSLFTVPGSTSGPVPVDQVVDYSDGQGPSAIDRFARTRQITISANMAPGASQQTVQEKVVEIFEKQNLGPLYAGQFMGRSKELGRTFSSFGTAFVLAIVFMYLILAAQFESWLHPLLILGALPLTLPFAIISLVVLHGSLNIFSMLGILVLFGVVAKNAILQVDHTNGLREKGLARNDAIVQACRDRLRPILMTTLAFVAGMVPLAISSGTGAGTNRATSSVIIGGQALSLLLTLVATPVFYSLMDDLAVALHRLHSRVFHRHLRDEALEEG